MTQPEDWTQDRTDALGDVVWDKIVAERDAAIAERDALRTALREVKDLLPLVFESSAAYDKIMVLLSK